MNVNVRGLPSAFRASQDHPDISERFKVLVDPVDMCRGSPLTSFLIFCQAYILYIII